MQVIGAPAVGEWLTSYPSQFTPGKTHSTHWTGGWVGPTTILDILEKQKISCPYHTLLCSIRICCTAYYFKTLLTTTTNVEPVTITNPAAKRSSTVPVTAVASWWCDDARAAFKITLHSSTSVFTDTCRTVLLKFSTCRKVTLFIEYSRHSQYTY